MEWRELNCTTHFARFSAEVNGLVGSLASIVFHQAALKAALLEHLAVPGSLAVVPLAALAAMLARDLASDFGTDTFEALMGVFLGILRASESIEDIEAVMRTVFYLARVLEKPLLGDLAGTFARLFRSGLDTSKQAHVVQMLVELWATLGRRVLLGAAVLGEVCAMARTDVAGQCLAAVCVDGTGRGRFLPKHLRAIAGGLLELGQKRVLEAFLGHAAAHPDAAAAIDAALAGLQDAGCLEAIAGSLAGHEGMALTALALLQRAAGLPGCDGLRGVDMACGLLRQMYLQDVLKARPALHQIFAASTLGGLRALLQLVDKPDLVHPLFSAAAIERLVAEGVAAGHACAALALVEQCVQRRDPQLPGALPAGLDTGALLASPDAAVVILALRLVRVPPPPAQALALCEQLGGPAESPVGLAILDAWARPGLAAEAVAPVVRLVCAWSPSASALGVLARLAARTPEAQAFARLGLLSGESAVRAAALSLFEPGTATELGLRLETQSAWSFSCDREKGIHLGALFHQLGAVSAAEADLVLRQLLGIVLGGIRPVQAEAGRVLAAYAGKHGALFRAAFADVLRLAGLPGAAPGSSGAHDADTFFSPERALAALTAAHAPGLAYGPFALTSLFDCLTAQPAAMDFVQNDVLALLAAVFGPAADAPAGLRARVEGALAGVLAALAGLKNLGRNPRADELVELLLSRFLPLGDDKIQRRAVAAFAAARPLAGIDFSALLESEQALRDQLVVLVESPVALEGPELAVMVRVLYGRMVARKGAGAGRSSPKQRRKLVLTYVASWGAPAVGAFVRFLLETAPPGAAEKRVLGLLGMLEPVLDKLARFMPTAVFGAAVDRLLAVAVLEARAVRRLAMQRLHQAWRLVLTHAEDAALEAALTERFPALWAGVVGPRVARLAEEYGQAPSALLDLLVLWAETRPALLQDACLPMAAALGEVAMVKPAIAAQLIRIWEALPEPMLHGVLGVLLASVARRLAALVGREEHVRVTLRLVALLLRLSPLVAGQSELVAALCTTLLESGIVGKRAYARMAQLHTDVLRVLARLLPLAPAVCAAEPTYRLVAAWFGLPLARPARDALCLVFGAVAPADAAHRALAAALTEMSAFDATQVDAEPDYERRAAGFNSLKRACAAAPPTQVLWWLPVLSMAMHDLVDEAELGVRNQAAFLLESFLAHPLDPAGAPFQELVMGQLWRGIRAGLKRTASEAVRGGLLALLRALVQAFPAAAPFAALQPLLAQGDEEADVLLNLGHVQAHRRVRAVRRLAEHCAPGGLPVSRQVVEDLLLPFLAPLAIPAAREDAPILDAHLQNEAIVAFAVLVGRLPAKTISARIVQLLKRLRAAAARPIAPGDDRRKTSPTVRALLRVLPAIVQHAPPAYLGEAADLLLGLLFDAAVGPGAAAAAALPLCEAIGHILITCAGDGDLQARHLPRLMATLCQGLRDKDVHARDASRRALCKLMARLGPGFLLYALAEMEAVLVPASHAALRAKAGSALVGSNTLFAHVHGYSVAVLAEGVAGPVSDAAYARLVAVAVEHGFGHLAREKTRGSTGASGQEWTGRAIEARSQKAYSLLGHLARTGTDAQVRTLVAALGRAVNDEPEQVAAALAALEAALLHRVTRGGPLQPHMVLLHDLVTERLPAGLASDHWELHAHRFRLAGLGVLTALVKAARGEVAGFLDGFVDPLLGMVAGSKHLALTAGAVRCLVSLVANAPFVAAMPALTEPKLAALVQRLFELMVKTDAARQPELLAAILRLVSGLVRQLPQVALSDSQTRALLAYTREHLESSADGTSTLAFTLVKALLSRKVMLLELLDLVASVQRTMIVSPDAAVRAQCRAVYLRFLAEYPLGADKLREHLGALVKNAAGFEWDTGRRSVVQLLAALVGRLPAGVLLEWASVLLVTAASRMSPAAEPSAACRAALLELVGALVARLAADAELAPALQEACTLLRKWVDPAAPSKPAVVLAAWTLAPAVVAALGADPFGLRPALQQQALAHVAALDAPLLVPALDTLLALGAASDALLDGALLMYGSLEVRDRATRLVLEAGLLTAATAAPLADQWSKHLLDLPPTCEAAVAARVVHALLAALPLCPPEAVAKALARIEGRARPILSDPAMITANRATLAAALRLCAGLLVKLDAPADAVLQPLLGLAVRISTCDQLSATQSSSVDRELAESLRSTSNELLELAQTALGTDRYASLTQQIINDAAKSRSARKAQLSQLAVCDPEAYAKRKMTRNASKKEQRKRKVDKVRDRAQKRQRPAPQAE